MIIIYPTCGAERAFSYGENSILYKYLRKKGLPVRRKYMIGKEFDEGASRLNQLDKTEKQAMEGGGVIRVVSSHDSSLHNTESLMLEGLLVGDAHPDFNYNHPFSKNGFLNYASWISYALLKKYFSRAGVFGCESKCLIGDEILWAGTINEISSGKIAFLPAKEVKQDLKKLEQQMRFLYKKTPFESLTEIIKDNPGWGLEKNKVFFKEKHGTSKKNKMIQERSYEDFIKTFFDEVNPERTLASLDMDVLSFSVGSIKKEKFRELIGLTCELGVTRFDFAIETPINKPLAETLYECIALLDKKIM